MSPAIATECPTGRVGGCLSFRCGSDCTNEFDRCHPCPACAALDGGAATFTLAAALLAAHVLAALTGKALERAA